MTVVCSQPYNDVSTCTRILRLSFKSFYVVYFLVSNPFTKDDSSLLVATSLIQLKIKFLKFLKN